MALSAKNLFRPILWFYAAGFLAVGVYIFAGREMTSVESESRIILGAGAYFFPVVLYTLGAKWLAPVSTLPQANAPALAPAPEQSLRLISLCGVLYLSQFIALYVVLFWSGSRGDRTQLAWSTPVVLLLLWLFLGLLHNQLSFPLDAGHQARRPLRTDEGKGGSRRSISDRLLTSAGRLLLPSLLGPLGAALVALSLLLRTSENGSATGWQILRGGGPWVTSNYGFGEGVEMLQPVLAVLGWGLYAGGVIVAGLLVIALASARLQRESAQTFRFIRRIYGCTAILAAYSIADLFFGWLGFFSSGSPSAQEVLAFLWFTYCLLLLGGAIRLVFVAGTRLSEEEPLIRRTFLLLYLPPALFTLVLLPTLVGLELGGLACFFIDLQFLCWNFLELSARVNATHSFGRSR